MVRRIGIIIVLLGLLFTNSARAEEDEFVSPLGKGDQSSLKLDKGFFVDTDLGILTFLILDGARVYKPGGWMISMRLGGMILKNLSLYGRIGLTINANSRCYTDIPTRQNADYEKRCPGFFNDFPSARLLRGIPRQGMSILAGLGTRWFFLTLEERYRFYLSFELLAQLIPPDNIPDDRLKKLENQKDQIAKHLSFSFGGGGGVGFGFEYFFYLKHFSFGVNSTFYFFATQFMPGKFPNGLLGASLLVSLHLKYTF